MDGIEKLMACIIAFFAALIAFGFYNEHKYEQKIISSERILVRAINITQPKHVSVDLIELQTGKEYHEYVSKWFDSDEVTLGKPFYVIKEVHHYVRMPLPDTYEIRGVREGLETTMHR